MVEILFLLLPLAFYSGWKAARKKFNTNQSKERQLSGHFVKGVNYLLSEEPDKALEVFLNYPDIDKYTAETYQLLGNLFRNRGEVDRALRVHQNLIARTNLSNQQKHKAMFSLGQDFFDAGMLDRAESVFFELLNNTKTDKQFPKSEVCTSLRIIYEQTQEWEKAIGVADCYNKFKKNNDNQQIDIESLVAHYYCELADTALNKGNIHKVYAYLSKAKRSYKQSTRLMSLEGDKLFHQKKFMLAINKYFLAINNDARLVNMLFEKINSAALEIDGVVVVQEKFLKLYRKTKNRSLFEKILIISKQYNLPSSEVDELIIQDLSSDVTNIETIFNASEYMKLDKVGISDDDGLRLINNALSAYLKGRPVFCCTQCGYKMNDFLWRCPACHEWDSIDHA